MPPARVAAIDCGTNSIRLLICEIEGRRKRDVVRELRIVRLGAGVDASGRLSPAALERTFEAAREYARLIDEHAVDTVRFCATSATRDARNAAVFAEGVEAIVAVRPEVLSGAQEAEATFLGAARDLPADAGTVLVVDLGGGSTELVLGRDAALLGAHSLDIGSVRMTERHLVDDPPSAEQIAACAAEVDAALDTADVDLAAADTVVGVAGTITSVAAHVLGLESYDAARIHHARLDRRAVADACRDLVRRSVAERLELPFLHPGRADVIGAGAVICERVLARTRVDDLLVSESDILDGIAWGAVER